MMKLIFLLDIYDYFLLKYVFNICDFKQICLVMQVGNMNIIFVLVRIYLGNFCGNRECIYIIYINYFIEI